MAVRRFYGAGKAKDFSKKAFYEAVIAYVTGEDTEEDTLDLIVAACEFELEGIRLAKEKSGSKAGEPTPTLEKQIAKDIIANLVPMLSGEPQTTEELIALAIQKGLVTSKGTNFSNPWVNTVFKLLAENGQIKRTTKITTVNREKDGMTLSSQEPKIAYTL